MNETRVGIDYLQEHKVAEKLFPNHFTFWNTCQHKRGYSGVSIITKFKPINFQYGFETKNHDMEGRMITLEYKEFFLVCVYVPNAGEGLKRLDYRVQDWDKVFQKYLKKLRSIKDVIVTGDFNCAYQDIDIYDPTNKSMQPGFTSDERNSFKKMLDSGYIDTFRYFYPDKMEFTFWANRARSRETNSGWRLDYFLVSDKNSFINKVIDSQILSNYMGSDHCPIKLILKH